jgi:Putative peptidoglycan binding domain
MRNFNQAKAFAIQEHRQPSREWFNDCQLFARQSVGALGFGTSARLAFNSIPREHKFHSSPPPPGSIAYYGRPDAGNGHAVLVVEGGKVWSNDILRHAKIDRVDWDLFTKPSGRGGWGLAYRGWIERCPSGQLPVNGHRGDKGKGHGGDGPGPGGQDKDDFRQGRKVFRSRMRFRQEDSDSVWNLQLALANAGFTFTNGPSGFYGRRTRHACRQFQHKQGWRGADADGIAGAETIHRLGLVWVEG